MADEIDEAFEECGFKAFSPPTANDVRRAFQAGVLWARGARPAGVHGISVFPPPAPEPQKVEATILDRLADPSLWHQHNSDLLVGPHVNRTIGLAYLVQARVELAALRAERDGLELSRQRHVDCLFEMSKALLDSGAKRDALAARVSLLEKWIHDAIVRGRREVEKANAEFGYDSLRFADVRHGWGETIGQIVDVPIPFPPEAAR